MRSSLLSIDYWYEYCHFIFPTFYERPLVELTDSNFGGFLIKSTRTFFTNGVEDPWKWAAMRTADEKLDQVAMVADCVDCAHCVELYTPKPSDPIEVKQIREDIRYWLRGVLHHPLMDTKRVKRVSLEFLN